MSALLGIIDNIQLQVSKRALQNRSYAQCLNYLLVEFLEYGLANILVNTVIFRGDAITTYQDYQFAAYYDFEGEIILANWKLDSQKWETNVTPHSGNVEDAHNSVSITADSEGFLYVSLYQHNAKLRYAKSTESLGLELSEEQPMTCMQQEQVNYPQFFNLENRIILFTYRSGESGRGNMVLKEYDPQNQQRVQLLKDNLLDGENWKLVDVIENGAGQWEPNYHVEQWKARQELHFFPKM